MHQYKLSRNTNERKALIRNVMRSLVLHGSIKTTKEKAKSASSQIERLITKAKMGTEAGKRAVIAGLVHKEVVKKLLDKATTQFASRNSGYTRIIKIGRRLGDATEEVILSFVDQEIVQEVIKPKETKKETQKKEEIKKEEIKKEEIKKEEIKKEEIKKEETKKEETKKAKPKKKVVKANI